jgi:hypothetical protein
VAAHLVKRHNIIAGKAYNSSEILALNDHQFLILERDGKGLGDGSNAKIKQVWAVDISGASDVSTMSGAADLLARAPAKTLFLDIQSALKAFGLAGPNVFYVFSFTDTDLAAGNLSFEQQRLGSVPEPKSLGLMLLGLGFLAVVTHRRASLGA